MNIKNEFNILALFLPFFLIFFSFAASSPVSVAADDERSESSSSSSREVITNTSTSTSTKTITINDSDGDGLLDNEDPHPNIAEIYIVKDDNLNGIVDDFESDNVEENE